MKKHYKALMLDLDGTTIPNQLDAMPSDKVISALSEASSKILIGVVTGRTKYWTKAIIRKLPLNAPSIISGGAEILDSVSGKSVWIKAIDQNALIKIEHLLKEQKYPYLIPKKSHNKLLTPRFYPLSKGLEVTNIAVPDLQPKEADRLFEILNTISSISIQKIVGWKTGTNWLQISHTQATKQYGILRVAKMLNISTQDIIGVGDGYNDMPLLMACGLKVAMGNAVPELKAIADYIAPSVEDDGVADVIKKFIL